MKKIISTLSLFVLSIPFTVFACVSDENRSVFEKVTDWIQHSISVFPVIVFVVLVVLRVILKSKGIHKYSIIHTVLMVLALVVGIAFLILENLLAKTANCV